MIRRNMIRQSVMVAMLVVTMTMTFAGCGKDPITGKDIFYGSLEVINEYNAPLGAVAVWEGPGSSGERIWSNPPGLNLEYDQAIVFTDVPVGVWSVFVGGSTIEGVAVVVGMTTTIVRTSGGGLTAGIPH